MPLFLIPKQTANIIKSWKQVCPICNSIDEITSATEYDLTIADRQYYGEKIYGFDYSNARAISKRTKNICTNCGYVFNLDE